MRRNVKIIFFRILIKKIWQERFLKQLKIPLDIGGFL